MRSIHIPDAREAAEVLGGKNLKFSGDFLTSQRPSELLELMRNTELEISSRFDAAMALREKNLHESTSTDNGLIGKLLHHVEVTTQPPTEHNQHGFTLEEKRIGILSGVALQGTVVGSERLLQMFRKWISDSLELLEADALLRGEGDTPSLRERKVASDHDLNKAELKIQRACLLLGKSNHSDDVELFANVLESRGVVDQCKIMAIHALCGINDPQIPIRKLLVFCDSDTTVFVKEAILSSMAVYWANNGSSAYELIQSIRDNLKKMIMESKLSLDSGTERVAAHYDAKFADILRPRYKVGEEEHARYQAGIYPWRVILELSSQDSLLVPNNNNAFYEVAPSGTNGDIISWKNLKLTN